MKRIFLKTNLLRTTWKRIYGYTDIRIYGYTGIQVYGYTGIQVYRYTGIQYGCTGYPAFFISGILPDIRFHLPDIRLAGYRKKQQKNW